MEPYYLIDACTPEDAPVVVNLSPGTPFGMALGKQVPLPQNLVATFTTLDRLQTAGWLGNCFFMAPILIAEVRRLGEQNIVEFPIVVCDESGRCDKEAIKGIVTLDNIACMDKEKSEFDVSEDDPNDIVRVRKLVLVEGKIPAGRHLFRMSEFCSALIASGLLVKALHALHVTGVTFVPPDAYRI